MKMNESQVSSFVAADPASGLANSIAVITHNAITSHYHFAVHFKITIDRFHITRVLVCLSLQHVPNQQQQQNPLWVANSDALVRNILPS